MDPIKDLQAGVTAGVLERLRNPLVGSFIISWSVYNWEIFLLLFSFTEPVAQRIANIHEVIFRTGSFSIPLAFAISYFFIAPWLWLILRNYQEMPESRLRRRHRLQREDNLLFENTLAEKETKLLLLRQQKLQSEREIALIREKINSYFEQAYEAAQSTYQGKLDQVLLNVEQLERDVLPRLSETILQRTEEFERLQRLVVNVPKMRGMQQNPTPITIERPNTAEKPRPLSDSVTLRALQEKYTEATDIPAFLRKSEDGNSIKGKLEALNSDSARDQTNIEDVEIPSFLRRAGSNRDDINKPEPQQVDNTARGENCAAGVGDAPKKSTDA